MAAVEIDLEAVPKEKMDLLCAALLPGILEHFKDPENQRRFAEWQKERAKKTTRFEIAALIMAALGALFLLGAVGNADFYGDYSTEDYIRIAIGLVLLLPMIGVGIKQHKEEKADTDVEIEEDYYDV